MDGSDPHRHLHRPCLVAGPYRYVDAGVDGPGTVNVLDYEDVHLLSMRKLLDYWPEMVYYEQQCDYRYSVGGPAQPTLAYQQRLADLQRYLPQMVVIMARLQFAMRRVNSLGRGLVLVSPITNAKTCPGALAVRLALACGFDVMAMGYDQKQLERLAKDAWVRFPERRNLATCEIQDASLTIEGDGSHRVRTSAENNTRAISAVARASFGRRTWEEGEQKPVDVFLDFSEVPWQGGMIKGEDVAFETARCDGSTSNTDRIEWTGMGMGIGAGGPNQPGPEELREAVGMVMSLVEDEVVEIPWTHNGISTPIRFLLGEVSEELEHS